MNLKNINIEPLYLRWKFFYYRDLFDRVPAEGIYQTLSLLIKIKKDLPLQISELKSDQYTSSIIDLMANAKKLLLSVKSSDFNSGLIDKHLNLMSCKVSERE